jgi:hypothetical protein
MAPKRKARGHFCWACERYLANRAFYRPEVTPDTSLGDANNYRPMS